MKRSLNRILTTHAGSLPRPEDLMLLYREEAPDSKLLPRLQSAITDVVKRQAQIGIDVVKLFAEAIKHRPRIRLTIRQRTRVLQQWPKQ